MTPNPDPGTEQAAVPAWPLLSLLSSLQLFSLCPTAASVVAAEHVFQDCTDIQRFGANASGIYTIRVANMTEPRKVRGLSGG